MTDLLAIAIAELAEVLEQENAALAELDLPRAAGLLARKQQAASRLTAAQQSMPSATPAQPAITRLRDAAERNRRLLERAIAVQDRVIGAIAAALPKAASPGRYAATGAALPSPHSVAFALRAHV